METATIETRPLTPEGRRRPDTAGELVPVRLGDGQEWPLPAPSFGLCARLVAGRVSAERCAEGPGDYAELFDRQAAATDDDEFLGAVFGMATLLLRSAYDVHDDELGALIRVNLGGERDESFLSIYSHCTGRTVPKN